MSAFDFQSAAEARSYCTHGLEVNTTSVPTGSISRRSWGGFPPAFWIFARSESPSVASIVCVGVALPGGMTASEIAVRTSFVNVYLNVRASVRGARPTCSTVVTAPSRV